MTRRARRSRASPAVPLAARRPRRRQRSRSPSRRRSRPTRAIRRPPRRRAGRRCRRRSRPASRTPVASRDAEGVAASPAWSRGEAPVHTEPCGRSARDRRQRSAGPGVHLLEVPSAHPMWSCRPRRALASGRARRPAGARRRPGPRGRLHAGRAPVGRGHRRAGQRVPGHRRARPAHRGARARQRVRGPGRRAGRCSGSSPSVASPSPTGAPRCAPAGARASPPAG